MRRPTTMPSMSRYLALLDTPRVQFVLIAASVLGLIIGLDTLILHLTTDPLADVHAYYDAGARLNAGLPLYDQPAARTMPTSIATRRSWRSPSGRWPCSRSRPPRSSGRGSCSSCSPARSGGPGSAIGGPGSSSAGWRRRSRGAWRSARRRSRSRSSSRWARRGRSRSRPTSRSCPRSSRSTGWAAATGGPSPVRGLGCRSARAVVRARAGGHDRVPRVPGPRAGRRRREPFAVRDLAMALGGVRRRLRGAGPALRPEPDGWHLAVAVSVFANPRLLMYQLSTCWPRSGRRTPSKPLSSPGRLAGRPTRLSQVGSAARPRASVPCASSPRLAAASAPSRTPRSSLDPCPRS